MLNGIMLTVGVLTVVVLTVGVQPEHLSNTSKCCSQQLFLHSLLFESKARA
jgi:hypothetical protein